MAMTIAERLAIGLIKEGATEFPGRTSRYRHFRFESGLKAGRTYFVGQNGGFRKGKSPSASRSLQGTAFHARLLAYTA